MRRSSRMSRQRLVAFATRYVLAPVAVLLAVRLIWGYEAARQLDATYAELRAEGVPLETKAFLEPVLPAERNALAPVMAAIGHLRLTEEERDLIGGAGRGSSMPYETQYTAADDAELDRIFAGMGQTFGDVDRAMALPEAQWNTEVAGSEGFGSSGGREARYDDVRFLAHAMVLAGRRAHERGDDGGCLHALEESLALARIMDADPTLFGHETAIGIRTQAAMGAQRFLGDLRIDGSDRAAAAELVKEFGEDRAVQQAQVRAFQYELAYHRDSLPTEGPLCSSWLLRPLMDTTVVRILELDASMLPAAASPIYDTRLLPKLTPAPTGALSDMVLPPLNGVMESFERAMILQARHLADARATAVLLAARMYEQEQHREAQDVRELRGYLAAAPLDPFAKGGVALHYRLDPTGPTVWSVGENGVDDHGRLTRSAGRVRMRYGQPDLVYGAAWTEALKRAAATRDAAPGARGKAVTGGAATTRPSR
ncbi:MAG TPA: hypothetical protein VHQ47_06970 [Phycisphaerae bacterium]|jgi:hypothetical protein|nr:hypothetical protein [Phycisphaerae bacterium]